MPGTFRQLLDQGGVCLGSMVFEFFTPGIGYILKNTGCHFVVFDMEHSGLDFMHLKSVLRYAEAADISTVVRVPSSRPDHIARALDTGARALMVPMVSSVEEAQAIVRAAKYPPFGSRGIAQQVGHDKWRGGSLVKNMQLGNDETTIIAQIETARGAKAARQIAGVPGIDVIWLGHADLSASLGAPGNFEGTAYLTALNMIQDAARTEGKRLGRMVPDAAGVSAALTQGFDILCLSTDVRLLSSALSAIVGNVKHEATGGSR